MTLPTSYNTVKAVIDRAYVNAGLIPAGSQANSQQYADGLARLNERTNYLQTKGLKLFTNVDTTLALAAGVSVYTLGPGALVGLSMTKPLRIPFAYYLNTNGDKVPLTQISRQELTVLNTLNQSGTPVEFFADKQTTQLIVTLWPTPDTTAAGGQVHLILQTQIPNNSMLTEAISFPIEWFNGLAWDLADEICTGQPSAIVIRCAMKAKEFIEALENWDVEDAETFLTVSPQMTYGSNDFV